MGSHMSAAVTPCLVSVLQLGLTRGLTRESPRFPEALTAGILTSLHRALVLQLPF